MSDNDVFCSNCRREVPRSNFVMHNVHCQRKLALCLKCDEPVPRCELATHNTNLHAIVDCPACGHQCEKRHLLEHQNSSCSHRPICCSYCHIETEANTLQEHENYCGSRTEKCDDCGEFVMLKYQQLHMDSNHGFLKLEDEPGPAPSWSNVRVTSSNLLNDLSHQHGVMNSQRRSHNSSTSNRLSRSKRTNDMPQVNSAAAAAPVKDLHKTTIPSDDGVDLDRLWALRLAEHERILNTISSVPSEVDLGVPSRKGGDEELVALPCEFCQAMVPANQLVLHETGCCPDLARYDPGPVTPTRLRKPSNSSEDDDNDGLPCEFCGILFPSQFLLQHQAVCDVTPPLHLHEVVFVNESSRPNKADNRRTKKFLNLASDTPRLFPSSSGDHGTNKIPYLNEMQVASKKPMASVRPIGHQYSSSSEFVQQNENEFGTANCLTNTTSGCPNGLVQHPTSTGAVPKQKAGRRVNTQEVSQEVSRPTSTTLMSTGNVRFRHTDNNR